MADTVDVVVKKSEGWKEVISSGGGFFSASKSCQYCFAQSKPSVFFYGHRLNTTEIQLYLLPEFDKMYVKADQDLTFVVSGFRSDELQRIFIKLNGIDGYFAVQNPITYAGDFSIKFELSGQPQADAKLISLKMPGSGKFTVSTDDGAPFTKIKITMADTTGVTLPSTIDTQNGKLNRCLITFNETTRLLSFFVNEQAAGSLTVAATAVPDFSATTGTEVGKEVGFNGNFTGIIANVDFGNGNAWPLDVLTGNTQQAVNGNNILTLVNIPPGAPDRELFTLNTVTDPDQWENADKSRIIQIA